MTGHESGGRVLVKEAGFLAGRLAALVAGAILMIVGIGLGVGLVTLPIAIPVGLAGLFVFLWGLFGRPEQAMPPPSSQDTPRGA
jgi:hypothetical protein